MSKVTDVDINLISNPDNKIVGIGRITLNGDITIDGVKVISGSKGLFVGMPSKKSQEGTWSDVVYATTKELKELIQKAVLEDYNKKIGKAPAAVNSENESEDEDGELPF